MIGALPVIISITGPRETHDYRVRNPLGAGYNLIVPPKKEVGKKKKQRTVRQPHRPPLDKAESSAIFNIGQTVTLSRTPAAAMAGRAR